MTSVEIIYRYEADGASPRPAPRDSEAACRRLDEGNRAFAALLDRLASSSETIRRIVPVDPRDVGLLPAGKGATPQRPFAAVLGCADAPRDCASFIAFADAVVRSERIASLLMAA
jgi:carbonic anhydrase